MEGAQWLTGRPAPTDPGRQTDVTFIVVGLAVLVIGALVVRDGSVSDPEEAVFNAVNDLPDALEPGALAVPATRGAVHRAHRRHRRARAPAVSAGDRRDPRHGGQARARTGRQGDGQPRAAGHLHRSRHQRPRRRVPQRRELRVRSCRPDHRAGRRRVSPYLHGRWKIVPWVLVGTGHGRPRLRRRPQPARRDLWRRPRTRHRRQRSTSSFGRGPLRAAAPRRRW